MKSCTSWICVAKGEITDAELESARKTLVNGWRTMLDDPLTLEGATGWDRRLQAARIARGAHRAGDRHHARAGHCRGTEHPLDTVFFMKGAAK